MYTYHTKVFTESLFETIAEWLNSFEKPKDKTHSEHSMQIIDYTIVPGYATKGTIAVITIRVFQVE